MKVIVNEEDFKICDLKPGNVFTLKPGSTAYFILADIQDDGLAGARRRCIGVENGSNVVLMDSTKVYPVNCHLVVEK